MSERIVSEEQLVPSTGSLWRHWLRTTYICMQWNNSHASDVYSTLPQPENSGWIKRNESDYEIDWEDPSLQMIIEKNTSHLLKGCKGKKGCGSKKCGCRQEERQCGPGCICVNCKNVPTIEMENIY